MIMRAQGPTPSPVPFGAFMVYWQLIYREKTTELFAVFGSETTYGSDQRSGVSGT